MGPRLRWALLTFPRAAPRNKRLMSCERIQKAPAFGALPKALGNKRPIKSADNNAENSSSPEVICT